MKIFWRLTDFISCRQGVIILEFCQISIHNSTLTGCCSHLSKTLRMGQLNNSSDIRQKGQISKWMLQEHKTHQTSRKNEHFLPPDDTHARVRNRGKKCSFFGKSGVLSFLVTLVLKFAFCLITGESPKSPRYRLLHRLLNNISTLIMLFKYCKRPLK